MWPNVISDCLFLKYWWDGHGVSVLRTTLFSAGTYAECSIELVVLTVSYHSRPGGIAKTFGYIWPETKLSKCLCWTLPNTVQTAFREHPFNFNEFYCFSASTFVFPLLCHKRKG